MKFNLTIANKIEKNIKYLYIKRFKQSDINFSNGIDMKRHE